MNRRNPVRRTAEVAAPEKAADTGFKSLDELRALIRMFGEWNADLGIPRPTRERPAQDLGSQP